VKRNVIDILAKVSGRLLLVYLVLKTLDTVVWLVSTAPHVGAPAGSFYATQPYGWWILIMELGVLGVIPAIILLNAKWRQNENILILACILNCTGIFLNRWVMTVQSLAVPVMSFDKYVPYHPNWVEYASTFLFVWAGVIVISISYRYLPIFPQEKELNP
jgi:molybdopterin-containing oxidoreductase family membrane subunit